MSTAHLAIPRQHLLANIRSLDGWIGRNGWAGWDPYDIHDTGIAETLRTRCPAGMLWLERANLLFPRTLRRVLRVRPTINPITVSLLASSWCALFRATGDDVYRQRYFECIRWLAKHSDAADTAALAWGAPFDWHTVTPILRGTPLSVTTALAGHSILDGWEAFGDPALRGQAARVAVFFRDRLPRAAIGDGVCFSYSAVDDFMVLNASLHSAAYLARYGALCGDGAALDLAGRAVRFVVRQQEPNGAWPYWAPGYRPSLPRVVDNFHSAAVLQWLEVCRRNGVAVPGIESAIERGVEYYITRLLTADGVPRYAEEQTYPIDIYSFAQAFVTFSCLARLMDAQTIAQMYRFTGEHLRSTDGYYYYQINRKCGVCLTTRIPYLRWSQAWMLWGLTNLLPYAS